MENEFNIKKNDEPLLLFIMSSIKSLGIKLQLCFATPITGLLSTCTKSPPAFNTSTIVGYVFRCTILKLVVPNHRNSEISSSACGTSVCSPFVFIRYQCVSFRMSVPLSSYSCWVISKNFISSSRPISRFLCYFPQGTAFQSFPGIEFPFGQIPFAPRNIKSTSPPFNSEPIPRQPGLKSCFVCSYVLKIKPMN